MARTNNLTNFLTDVASAIRTKEGTTNNIKAEEFDTRILNLTSGAGRTAAKTIYDDGIYVATDDELIGYSSVDIQVLNRTDKLYLIRDGVEELEVTGGHTYTKIQSNLYPTVLETQGDGYIALVCSQWGNAAWRPNNSLKLSGYTKLFIDYSFPNAPSDVSDEGNAAFNLVFSGLEEKNVFRGRQARERHTVEISVPSGVTDSQVFYFTLWNLTSLSNAKDYPVCIYNMWFEKYIPQLQDERVEIVSDGLIHLQLDEGFKAFQNVTINVNAGEQFTPIQNYLCLYNKGEMYTDLTGGYTSLYTTGEDTTWRDYTINANNIYLHANYSDGYTSSNMQVGTSNAIDLRDYSKIIYQLDIEHKNSNGWGSESIGVVSGPNINTGAGNDDVLAFKSITPTSLGNYSGFYSVELTSPVVGHPVVQVTAGQYGGNTSITIHDIIALKKDSWQTLYAMLGKNYKDYTEQSLIDSNEDLVTILNDNRMRNYLVNQCTGSLMFGFLNNTEQRAVITQHPNYYEFVSNQHWKFFLELFGANTDVEIPSEPEKNVPCNIFIQEEEPKNKNGLWVKTADYNSQDITIVTESGITFGESGWASADSYANLPQGNGYACSAELNGKMYFGGGHQNNKLFEYDVDTNAYTELPNIPYNFGWGGMNSYNGELYMFGGKHATTTAYKYNPTTQTYTQLANIPVGFVSAVSVTLGDKIYLVTGRPYESSSTRYNTIYEYNPTDNTYRLCNATIHSGDCKGAIGYKGYLYIFGGDQNNRTCYRYDPRTDTAKEMKKIPFDCTDTYACATDDAIYLVGSSGSPYALWKYEPGIDSYTQLPDVPISVWGPVSGALLNKKYLFAIGDTSSSHNKVRVYTISDKTYKNTPTEGLLIDQYDKSIKTIFTDPFESFFSTVKYYSNNTEIDAEIYYGDGVNWIKL